MSYKTILVHADLSVHAPARVRFAAALARAHGAHLIGAATTGISPVMSVGSGVDLERTVVAGYLDRLQEQSRQALVEFEALARSTCTGTWEARLVADDPQPALVMLSRFADLVVLSQTDHNDPVAGAVRDLPGYVILNSARPVLLLPYAGSRERIDGKALVAWDGSLAAARALGHALPLLRGASEVLVAQFDGADQIGAREQAADLGAWLARHGVLVRVEPQHRSIDAGNALLSLVADQQASLVVMGGYGHTRFRELVLGGVTRTMLESMTVPILIAH
jgi:nucleotide-binding universal stress UspA family protein